VVTSRGFRDLSHPYLKEERGILNRSLDYNLILVNNNPRRGRKIWVTKGV